MASKAQIAAMRQYGILMNEFKERLAAIETAANDETGLASSFAREFCFLQLRMMCEIVALGCLVAHGDILETQSQKVAKEYAADRIISRLETLHPRFFPLPISISRKGPNHHEVTDRATPHMSKSDLLKLYAICGSILHRGSMKKLASQEEADSDWAPKVMHHAQNLVNLLALHAVVMRGDDRVILYNLAQGSVSIGEAVV